MTKSDNKELYEIYFSDYRDLRLRMLQIGIGNGSLFEWFKKRFPKWEIEGLDIDEDVNGDDITIGDQADLDVLYQLGSFDIVIDDGSHRMSDQITTFRTLFRLMNEGGAYVIEKLHTSYWPAFKDLGRETTVEYLKRRVDSIQTNANDGNRSDMRIENNYKITGIHFYPSIVFVFK